MIQPTTKGRTVKRLALVFLLVAGACQADELMTANNTEGGLIVLTNEPCTRKLPFKKKADYLVYANNKYGYVQFGCWNMSKVSVFAQWETGTFTAYNRTSFTDLSGFNPGPFDDILYGPKD
jgi:hypothetical protein